MSSFNYFERIFSTLFGKKKDPSIKIKLNPSITSDIKLKRMTLIKLIQEKEDVVMLNSFLDTFNDYDKNLILNKQIHKKYYDNYHIPFYYIFNINEEIKAINILNCLIINDCYIDESDYYNILVASIQIDSYTIINNIVNLIKINKLTNNQKKNLIIYSIINENINALKIFTTYFEINYNIPYTHSCFYYANKSENKEIINILKDKGVDIYNDENKFTKVILE